MNTLMHFTILDYIIVATMVFSCVFAFFRGLVREILSLIAWVGSGIVTVCYFPAASASLAHHFKSPAVAAGIAAIGIYLISLIMISIINLIAVKSLKSGEKGGTLDNMLGLLFGAARGAFMVSLGFLLLTFVLPPKEYPTWLTQSVSRPYLEKGAAILASVTPAALREISSLEKKGKPTEDQNNVPPAASDSAANSAVPDDAAKSDSTANAADDDNNGETGYPTSSTLQMNRLVGSTERR